MTHRFDGFMNIVEHKFVSLGMSRLRPYAGSDRSALGHDSGKNSVAATAGDTRVEIPPSLFDGKTATYVPRSAFEHDAGDRCDLSLPSFSLIRFGVFQEVVEGFCWRSFSN